MPLTSRGAAYAQALNAFISDQESAPGSIWTSTLQRTIQTVAPLGETAHPLKVLDEIDAGICDGMTYKQIAEQMPGEYARRKADKLSYRYPRGESYEDVIRVLLGYLSDLERSAVPHLNIPLHTVISLTPRAYGCEVVHHPLVEVP
jgi:6-phosphofructo-2-kinase/fructose-2,6-biphosphatase 2